MDFQRILLLAGLGIITYMIMMQWQLDYGPQQAQPTQVTSVSAYDDQPVSTDFAVSPSNDNVITASNGTTAAPQAKLITVTTDALQVTIDTRGGDVIHTDLKNYLAEMDHP